MRVYGIGIVIAMLIGLSMQADQEMDAGDGVLESSWSSSQGRNLAGSAGTATTSYGSSATSDGSSDDQMPPTGPYLRVPCTDAEDCSGNGSASGFRPHPVLGMKGCSCQCRGGFDGPRCDKAPVGDKLTCDFGNEWVLPTDKMTDPSMREEIFAAMGRGTKVCFCKDADAAAQPHHTAMCRSDHTGAWSAQTALGYDKLDEGNCFCMKGRRPTPAPTPTAAHPLDGSYGGHGSHGSWGHHPAPPPQLPPTPASWSHGSSHTPFWGLPQSSGGGASSSYHGSSSHMHSGSSYQHGVDPMRSHGSHGSHGSSYTPSFGLPQSSGGGASSSYHGYSGSDTHTGSSYHHESSSYVHGGSSYTHGGSSYIHGGSSYDGQWYMVDGKWKWYSLGNEYAPGFSHVAYGSNDHNHGSSEFGSYEGLRCDSSYCTAACIPFIYCRDPSRADANCVHAPTDCDERCAGCGDPNSSGHNATNRSGYNSTVSGYNHSSYNYSTDNSSGYNGTGSGHNQYSYNHRATNSSGYNNDSFDTGETGTVYSFAGAYFRGGWEKEDYLDLADASAGLGFSDSTEMVFDGNSSISIEATIQRNSSLGPPWYSDLFAFASSDFERTGYGINHLMVYILPPDANGTSLLCFAVNNYNCEHEKDRCCIDALVPDEVSNFRFAVSAAGDRTIHKDGQFIWSAPPALSQHKIGPREIPGGPITRPLVRLRVGRHGCCGTFPGSITNIRITVSGNHSNGTTHAAAAAAPQATTTAQAATTTHQATATHAATAAATTTPAQPTVDRPNHYFTHEGFEIFGVNEIFEDDWAPYNEAPQQAVKACARFGGKPVGNYPSGPDCDGTVHVFTTKPAGLGSSEWCNGAKEPAGSRYADVGYFIGNSPPSGGSGSGTGCGSSPGKSWNQYYIMGRATGGCSWQSTATQIVCAAPPATAAQVAASLAATAAPQGSPTDCVLSDWSSWSNCTKECSAGFQHRSRSITHKATNGGNPCQDGDFLDERRCNTAPCPGHRANHYFEWEGMEIFGVDGTFNDVASNNDAPQAAIAACAQFGGKPVGNYAASGHDCGGTVHVFTTKPAGLSSGSEWCSEAKKPAAKALGHVAYFVGNNPYSGSVACGQSPGKSWNKYYIRGTPPGGCSWESTATQIVCAAPPSAPQVHAQNEEAQWRVVTSGTCGAGFHATSQAECDTALREMTDIYGPVMTPRELSGDETQGRAGGCIASPMAIFEFNPLLNSTVECSDSYNCICRTSAAAG